MISYPCVRFLSYLTIRVGVRHVAGKVYMSSWSNGQYVEKENLDAETCARISWRLDIGGHRELVGRKLRLGD
jgi:hypothetical protein